MAVSNIYKLSIACILALLLSHCSQSAAQRDFEAQALASPAGITEMTVNGTPVEGGEKDPNDWRIAPDFTGSISVETAAYPNPVMFNSDFEILLNVNNFESVNGLQLFAFLQPGQMIGPLYQQNGQLDPGFIHILLNTEQFASSTGVGNFGSLYRIIIYDDQLNVISYGDVQVQ